MKYFFNNLYNRFIHISGRVAKYDKLFFVVWSFEDPEIQKFVDTYLNKKEVFK